MVRVVRTWTAVSDIDRSGGWVGGVVRRSTALPDAYPGGVCQALKGPLTCDDDDRGASPPVLDWSPKKGGTEQYVFHRGRNRCVSQSRRRRHRRHRDADDQG